MAPERLHEVTGSYTMSRKARGEQGPLKTSGGMGTKSKMVSRREDPLSPPPASPSPRSAQARTQDTAGSTKRLLYSMILILQDLTSPPLGTLHLPIQSAKKPHNGSFSCHSSAFPPSFSSAAGSKRERGRRGAVLPVPK